MLVFDTFPIFSVDLMVDALGVDPRDIGIW